MKDKQNNMYNSSLIESIPLNNKSKIIPKFLYTLNTKESTTTINVSNNLNKTETNDDVPLLFKLNKKSLGKPVKKIDFLKKMNNSENTFLNSDKKNKNYIKNYKNKEKNTSDLKILSENSSTENKDNPGEVIINKHKLIINYNNYKSNDYSNYQRKNCQRNHTENFGNINRAINLKNILLSRPIKASPKISDNNKNDNDEIIKVETNSSENIIENSNEEKNFIKKKYSETNPDTENGKRIVSKCVNKSLISKKFSNVLKNDSRNFFDEKNVPTSPYNLTMENKRKDTRYKTDYRFYSNSSNPYGKYMKKYYQDFNLNNSKNSKNNIINIEIKLEDLTINDSKLNDVILALSNKNKFYEGGASKECGYYISFYFNSTLVDEFPCFFNFDKRIFIRSAINLKLFIIILTYCISLDSSLLITLLEDLKFIFCLLKKIIYLLVKKIEIFYGEDFIYKNLRYFHSFNNVLIQDKCNNFNEEDIVATINNNCFKITESVKSILNYLCKMNIKYYKDFDEMFRNISNISEKDIYNYFNNYLCDQPQPINTTNTECLQKKNSVPIYHHNVSKSININKQKTRNININIMISDSKENSLRNYIRKGNIISQHTPNSNNVIVNKNFEKDEAIVKSIKRNNYGNKSSQNIKIKNLMEEYQKIKVPAPFITTPCKKKYTLVLDLNETLVYIDGYNPEISDATPNKYKIFFRPGLFTFLSMLKPFYELITFTGATKEYAEPIVKLIEANKKYFDYNFYREHTVLNDNEFVKDISRIGRDIKKIIIVDNNEKNFKLNKENAIKIAPYKVDKNIQDSVLFELKKILILIHRLKYDDLRLALKSYTLDIKKKVSLED